MQSQLASLTSNPYGDNPLFKNLLPDNNRREDIMKPTNPVAQKAALNSPQYKVSPHGLKAKVKPLTGPGSASKAGKKQFNSINDPSEVKNRFESNIEMEWYYSPTVTHDKFFVYDFCVFCVVESIYKMQKS